MALAITLAGNPLDFSSESGFDIPRDVSAPASNAAVASGSGVAALTVGGVSALFRIDLTNGNATLLGSFGTAVRDIAITSGIFRVTRKPEDGVTGLDHGGRYLAVMKRVEGEWLMWRDMDTPSPDADVFYNRLPRGG